MFAKLEKYRQQHGDCLVPTHYKEDPSLGIWVSTQCSRCSNLDFERITTLNFIGFIWELWDQQWENMFAKVEQYREQHGDCLVPARYEKDPSTWFMGHDSSRKMYQS
jgi:hypothetical protein